MMSTQLLTPKICKRGAIFLGIVVILLSFQIIGSVNARTETIPGFQFENNVKGGEGWVIYNCGGQNQYQFISPVNLKVEFSTDPQLSQYALRFNVTNNVPVQLTIELESYENRFNKGEFRQGQYRYQNRWGAYLKIHFNTTVELLNISADIGNEHKVYTGDVWSISETVDEWTPLETAEQSSLVTTEITVVPTDIYLSIFSPVVDSTVFIAIIIGVSIAFVAVTILMSNSEYRAYIKNRLIPYNEQRHRLSIDDVLENENRTKIIELVLSNPGIHFNELLRLTELSPGNLVWHLDVLENYKVIGKKNIGQYIVYFPYYDTNPMSNIDIKLAKSKVTLEILALIEKCPGIYANSIADQMKLDHKTVKYHLDKLFENKLIHYEKVGRKNHIFPIVGQIKELKIDRDLILSGKPEREI